MSDCVLAGTGPSQSYASVGDGWQQLFEGLGSNSLYQNTWTGWKANSEQYTSDTGVGRRCGYSNLALAALRFTDSSDNYAQYTLNSDYQNMTLLQIVRQCFGCEYGCEYFGYCYDYCSSRNNNGGPAWLNGHCTVGYLTESRGGHFASNLRLGVGDGSSDDSDDWALFMPAEGNGNGDFFESSVWNIGGEDRTNDGYDGSVWILGSSTGDCIAALVDWCML